MGKHPAITWKLESVLEQLMDLKFLRNMLGQC